LVKRNCARRLNGEEYDPSIPSTHGITITSVEWDASEKSPILNLWDFGGQDIYHGAHSLFMATRAVFVIVWHPEFEKNEETEHEGIRFRNNGLPYWLDYVRHLGGANSPVILVQSQCDRLDQEIQKNPVDEALLDFPFLRPCRYSAKTGRGEATLREAVERSVEYLRGREGIASIGKGRMRVLRQLREWRKEDEPREREKREHRTLTQAEFESLCGRTGGVSSPVSLLEYLHNAGAVYWRQELFDDRIILDQTWALEAIYSVFDRKKSFRQLVQLGGRFTRSLLELTVWSDYEEKEQRLFLSLMESCGVCFIHKKADRWSDAETEYIAPDLLPQKDQVIGKLAGRWDDSIATITVEYAFPFLHQGLIRTVISELGEKAGDAAEYWKYGIWAYDADSGGRAIVEHEMRNDREGVIRVRAQHDDQGRLLKWIRERIEDKARSFGCREREITQDGKPFEEIKATREERPPSTATNEEMDLDGSRQKTAREPRFTEPPREHAGPQVFVSYGWGDATPEGRAREHLVNDLCATMKDEHCIEIIRDKTHMEVGDRISKFMDRIAEGDSIIAVISDKYLRSPYCMYELFRIYRNCADHPERFLKRVIPLILPDAKLDPATERLKYARYWKEQKETMGKELEDVGADYFDGGDLQEYQYMKSFAENVSPMLRLLNDKMFPRDFDRQAKENFKEILDLIRQEDSPR
jgi:internalin A